MIEKEKFGKLQVSLIAYFHVIFFLLIWKILDTTGVFFPITVPLFDMFTVGMKLKTLSHSIILFPKICF